LLGALYLPHQRRAEFLSKIAVAPRRM
jgi:hypothetical protein